MLYKLLLALVVVCCLHWVAEGHSSRRSKRQASPVLKAFIEKQQKQASSSKTSVDNSSNLNSSKHLKNVTEIIQELIEADPELIANWVQLSFHDCFGPEGCNGCIDLENPGNHGLGTTYRLALLLRSYLAPWLSNADFLALLGTEAAKAGAINGGGSLNLPFSKGRQDCLIPLPDTDLPIGNTTDTVSILMKEFSLTTREAVALMGAHSLGRARPENTGFSGPWDRTENGLDVGYFFVLNSDDLQSRIVNNSRIKSSQWNNPQGRLMLIADMILRKQFTLSGEFDTPSCGVNNITECTDQTATAAMTREFFDLATFHEAFSVAYLKMINKSNHKLHLLESNS